MVNVFPNDVAEVVDQIIGRDLNAFLGSGNDEATIGVSDEVSKGIAQALMEVHHNLLVDAGSGNDTVEIGNLTIGNNLFAFLGAGNDTLSVFGSSGSGKLLALGGPGQDTFNNDLGIDSNGTQGDVTVLEFELFNTAD